jgi:hypothetical protein
MSIITTIQKSIGESAEGWRMGFASLNIFGGGSAPMQNLQKSEIGTALIGPGFSEAQQRYFGIKAGEISAQAPGTAAPVGVRYAPAPVMRGEPVVEQPAPGHQWTPRYAPAPVQLAGTPIVDPGTPATVIETIQKSIGESAEGWRMGFAHVAGKAQASIEKTIAGSAERISQTSEEVKKGVEKSIAGWQMGISEAGGKVSESFGNIGGGLSSFKYPLYALVAVFLFIAVLIAVGYSGVGGPTARIAEKEYAKRR